MPGFIEQHMLPFLGAMTLITEVIANEDWILPGKTFKAATTPAQYRARLTAAHEALGASSQWLYSWGYHKLWHGALSRSELDKISRTRPIYGAIGVSGAPSGEADEACARTGIKAIADAIEFCASGGLLSVSFVTH